MIDRYKGCAMLILLPVTLLLPSHSVFHRSIRHFFLDSCCIPLFDALPWIELLFLFFLFFLSLSDTIFCCGRSPKKLFDFHSVVRSSFNESFLLPDHSTPVINFFHILVINFRYNFRTIFYTIFGPIFDNIGLLIVGSNF